MTSPEVPAVGTLVRVTGDGHSITGKAIDVRLEPTTTGGDVTSPSDQRVRLTFTCPACRRRPLGHAWPACAVCLGRGAILLDIPPGTPRDRTGQALARLIDPESELAHDGAQVAPTALPRYDLDAVLAEPPPRLTLIPGDPR